VRGQLLGVGAVSIGTNPTFNGTSGRLEVFILDLYGQLQEIDIFERIRGQLTFASVDGLISQTAHQSARRRCSSLSKLCKCPTANGVGQSVDDSVASSRSDATSPLPVVNDMSTTLTP
jgi:hypothetical protein